MYELNRLVRLDDLELPLSSFVSGVLRLLRAKIGLSSLMLIRL